MAEVIQFAGPLCLNCTVFEAFFGISYPVCRPILLKLHCFWNIFFGRSYPVCRPTLLKLHCFWSIFCGRSYPVCRPTLLKLEMFSKIFAAVLQFVLRLSAPKNFGAQQGPRNSLNCGSRKKIGAQQGPRNLLNCDGPQNFGAFLQVDSSKNFFPVTCSQCPSPS